MNFAISNIAWPEIYDKAVYEKLYEMKIGGLEIAPTRLFKENPYDKIDDAVRFAEEIKAKYGLCIPSMQSIWYGIREKIWGGVAEREFLKEYTKKAIDFASAIDCNNLVFGCPKNRVRPDDADLDVAIQFFKELGDYAAEKRTCIGVEANPTIYNTNFLNTTAEAIEFIKLVGSKGIKLNLDLGTMIFNGEGLDVLDGNISLINHVHISEPQLRIIKRREEHRIILNTLSSDGYKGFFSVEVGMVDNYEIVLDLLKYIKKLGEECIDENKREIYK